MAVWTQEVCPLILKFCLLGENHYWPQHHNSMQTPTFMLTLMFYSTTISESFFFNKQK